MVDWIGRDITLYLFAGIINFAHNALLPFLKGHAFSFPCAAARLNAWRADGDASAAISMAPHLKKENAATVRRRRMPNARVPPGRLLRQVRVARVPSFSPLSAAHGTSTRRVWMVT